MHKGRIYKAISGFYYVEVDGETIVCKARGRFRLGKNTPLVGDMVLVSLEGDKKGNLEEILSRKNHFIRPAVANIDQLIIVAANVNPVTDPFLIDRVAVIAEMNDCDAVILINKADMDPGDKLFEIYSGAGYKTIRTSAVTGEGIEELRAVLSGKISAFTGNSGVGKSSILNALEPGFSIKTGAVSEKLGRGRHTTRHVELYSLDQNAILADTPGFSSFEIFQPELFEEKNIQHAFRDFSPYIGTCRFHDCAHLKEAGCAIKRAVKEGGISPSRYKSYVRLYEWAKEIRPWEIKG